MGGFVFLVFSIILIITKNVNQSIGSGTRRNCITGYQVKLGFALNGYTYSKGLRVTFKAYAAEELLTLQTFCRVDYLPDIKSNLYLHHDFVLVGDNR